MTLFEKIADEVPMGWKIGFRTEAFNTVVMVSRTIYEKEFNRESWLPTHDHLTEHKIVGAIEFMITEIQKENTNHNKQLV